jgi:hypothetical protein
MNNKGFGLQECLVFIGLFMFILVAATIYGRAKLQGNNTNNTNNYLDYSNSINELKPADIEEPNEYIKLENKLKEASEKYTFDKSENIIISLKKLKEEHLIDNLVDPNNSNIKCDGYVVYNSTENKYTPYINCNGMYTTEAFNNDFID